MYRMLDVETSAPSITHCVNHYYAAVEVDLLDNRNEKTGWKMYTVFAEIERDDIDLAKDTVKKYAHELGYTTSQFGEIQIVSVPMDAGTQWYYGANLENNL